MIPYTTHPELFSWENLKDGLKDLLMHALLLALVIITMLLLTSCGTSRHIQTVPIETIKEVIKTDTLYLSNMKYDSIYVYQGHDQEYHRGNPSLSPDSPSSIVDTIFIKDKSIEYKYQLLRDTIERIKLETVHDSIPYEVRIETVKEVPRKRTTFDIISYWCFGIVVGMILFLIYRIVRKFML